VSKKKNPYSGLTRTTYQSVEGGILTESFLNEQLEAMKHQPHYPAVDLILKQQAVDKMRKKYPELFERDFTCSWQRHARVIDLATSDSDATAASVESAKANRAGKEKVE
jgi:hypothetical protein